MFLKKTKKKLSFVINDETYHSQLDPEPIKNKRTKRQSNVSNKIRKKQSFEVETSKLTQYPSSTKEAGRYLQKRIKKRFLKKKTKK